VFKEEKIPSPSTFFPQTSIIRKLRMACHQMRFDSLLLWPTVCAKLYHAGVSISTLIVWLLRAAK
jgi:hypothetical protein